MGVMGEYLPFSVSGGEDVFLVRYLFCFYQVKCLFSRGFIFMFKVWGLIRRGGFTLRKGVKVFPRVDVSRRVPSRGYLYIFRVGFLI